MKKSYILAVFQQPVQVLGLPDRGLLGRILAQSSIQVKPLEEYLHVNEMSLDDTSV